MPCQAANLRKDGWIFEVVDFSGFSGVDFGIFQWALHVAGINFFSGCGRARNRC
jgi:hypothetical protein